MNLRRLFALPLAVLAVLFTQQTLQAQTAGYQFGVGYGYAQNLGYAGGVVAPNRFGLGRSFDNNQIPYFALHPPVYYSEQIVRRPYGVSPFAAPPGIMPVEMTIAPDPVIITNPHFQPSEKKIDPKAGKKKAAEKPNAKPKVKPKKSADDSKKVEKKPKKPADQPKKENKNKANPKKAPKNNANADSQVNVFIINPFFTKTVEQTPAGYVLK